MTAADGIACAWARSSRRLRGTAKHRGQPGVPALCACAAVDRGAKRRVEDRAGAFAVAGQLCVDEARGGAAHPGDLFSCALGGGGGAGRGRQGTRADERARRESEQAIGFSHGRSIGAPQDAHEGRGTTSPGIRTNVLPRRPLSPRWSRPFCRPRWHRRTARRQPGPPVGGAGSGRGGRRRRCGFVPAAVGLAPDDGAVPHAEVSPRALQPEQARQFAAADGARGRASRARRR